MKIRSAAEIEKVLKKKGFEEQKSRKHHKWYVLMVDGKKSRVNTYLSHNGQDYGKKLMGEVKKQLCFDDTTKMEDYFDCTFSEADYKTMLMNNRRI
jgi:predicted RNA binding protein YcfA (HicA-like mRNA interferase family)